MTVMFKDVHNNTSLQEQLRKHEVLNAVLDDVMYADDTIIFSHDPKTLELLLAEIECEGSKYGMKLNKNKCEVLCTKGVRTLRFNDGRDVPKATEAKYLGCILNDKGDPRKEISKRISECFLTWKRLSEFWKHSNCIVKTKLQVYDAVIRTKLVYGLESVQLNDSLKSRIDAFQLKGLRQILKMRTTYVDRANSNTVVFQKANDTINSWRERQQLTGKYLRKKEIIPISKYYETQRRKLIITLITSDEDDPIANICVNKETLTLKDYAKWRIGRPRNNWWKRGIEEYWSFLTQHHFPDKRGAPIEVETLKDCAARDLGVR